MSVLTWLVNLSNWSLWSKGYACDATLLQPICIIIHAYQSSCQMHFKCLDRSPDVLLDTITRHPQRPHTRQRSKDPKRKLNFQKQSPAKARQNLSLDKKKSPFDQPLLQLKRKRQDKIYSYLKQFKVYSPCNYPTPTRTRQKEKQEAKSKADRFFSSNKNRAKQRPKNLSEEKKENKQIFFKDTIRRKEQDKLRRIVSPLDFDSTSNFCKTKTNLPSPKNQQEPQEELGEEEKKIYGNRFPQGFQKVKLLGQGGFAAVWLGLHIRSGKQFAIKQILTSNQQQTHKKQIWFGTYFFELGGHPKKQFSSHPGMPSISRMISYEINLQDTWIIYQRGGHSLGKSLWQLMETQHVNLDLYKARYKPLMKRMKSNNQVLKRVMLQMSQALELLSQNNIVHSDLKTENILINIRKGQQIDCKLIDYGSCFIFQGTHLDEFSMATPQYMSPELLSFIQKENGKTHDPELVKLIDQYHHPWVIDIWSLGCVLLEILQGIPLWMNYPTVITKPCGKTVTAKGAFAVQGRKFDRIVKKQLSVLKGLDRFLDQQCHSGIEIDPTLRKVLKGCLQMQPDKRMRPRDIVKLLERELS